MTYLDVGSCPEHKLTFRVGLMQNPCSIGAKPWEETPFFA